MYFHRVRVNAHDCGQFLKWGGEVTSRERGCGIGYGVSGRIHVLSDIVVGVGRCQVGCRRGGRACNEEQRTSW
jgi:hypothetical protein